MGSEMCIRDRVFTDPSDTCQELAEFNPYYETPTLVDRDLILYDPYIINEYLDERLPHPPLMPVDQYHEQNNAE